jgi:hypothetical protein
MSLKAVYFCLFVRTASVPDYRSWVFGLVKEIGTLWKEAIVAAFADYSKKINIGVFQ